MCIFSCRKTFASPYNSQSYSLISFETEMKVSSLVAEGSKAPEQMGPLNDEKALQELKNLGNILKALHLQVMVSKRSEEWVQVGVIIDHLLFSLYILFISVSFITIIFIWVNSYNTAWFCFWLCFI